MQTRRDVAEQLGRLRRERKLSQTRLAKISGLPQQLISRIERGASDFRIDSLLVLADALKARVVLMPEETIDITLPAMGEMDDADLSDQTGVDSLIVPDEL